MPTPEMPGCVMGETRERRLWHFGHWAGLALVCYFVPYVVLAIDEVAFDKQMRKGFSPGVQSFIELVYWPVIGAVHYLTGD
jgi:hypothetical protein